MRDKTELRPYQDRAVTWLYERAWGILVAPMGTGKTATTLTAIEEMLFESHIDHALVIAPKRVAESTWPNEVLGWSHLSGIKYAVCAGTPAQRKSILDEWESRHVTFIGIDNVQWLVEYMDKLPNGHPLFDLLVIDETSRLRNPKSKRARELLRIRKKFINVWGLTGTPRPNSELDFYMPAAVVTNKTLWKEGFYKWQRERFYATDYNGWNWAILPNWKEQTDQEFASITLAIDEKDMPELPDLNFIWDEVRLPPAAMADYEDMEKHLLMEKNGRLIEAANMGVAVGKLTQIATGFVYGEGGRTDVLPVHTAKLEWLTDLITDLQGEPLLVVYEHVADLSLIDKAAHFDVPRIGAGVGDREALEHIRLWNEGKYPVMAIHPASAGHGLNLQHGGHRMAWLSPCWSAEYWDQTIARLHRSGQEHPVFVHVAMAVGTIDYAKRLRVFNKLSAQAALAEYLKKA